MDTWINGRFVPMEEARISAFDAGVQHAVGLFETMGARNGRIFRADRHVARLTASAEALRLTERLWPGPLAEAAQATLEHVGLREARIRLTVTGGDLAGLPASGRSSADPTVMIAVQPPTPYPQRLFEQGVLVVIADGRLNPLDPMAGHKTLNYWARIRALQDAAGREAGEAIWFTVSNHVACGSVSNVLTVRDGVLRTPPARDEEARGALPSTVLPGITRAAVIEAAEARSIPVERTVMGIDDLLEAEEVFLTNASWGVLPVVRIEQETVGDGAVGAVTRMLRQDWLEMVERETAAG